MITWSTGLVPYPQHDMMAWKLVHLYLFKRGLHITTCQDAMEIRFILHLFKSWTRAILYGQKQILPLLSRMLDSTVLFSEHINQNIL